MRQLIMIIFISAAAACTGSKSAITQNAELNGTWLPVQQELGGTALPTSAFESQQLVIEGNTYTVIAESVDKGELKISDGKMDIYGKEGVNADKHYMAIYTLENDRLTICYNLAGDGYPASFDTKGSSSLFLSVFRKGLKK